MKTAILYTRLEHPWILVYVVGAGAALEPVLHGYEGTTILCYGSHSKLTEAL